MSSQLAPALCEVPSDGDRADAEEGCDRRRVEALHFAHHDDRPAPRRQLVERPPHDRSHHERRFGIIGLDGGGMQGRIVALANLLSAPLIATDVDQDPDQPGLFFLQSTWNGFRRPRRLEERFLDKVERIVDRRGQSSRKSIEPFFMRLEQRRQSSRLFRHTPLNVRRRPNVGSGGGYG